MATRCVMVSLGSETAGVPLADLTGVEQVPRVAPLPNVPPWVLGATHHQGIVYSVVDLALALGLTSAAVRASSARMLLHRDRRARLALAVTGATVMRTFATESTDTARLASTVLVPYCKGSLEDGNDVYPLLDSRRILDWLLQVEVAT
jgi:chemotaxis signal transduction protein